MTLTMKTTLYSGRLFRVTAESVQLPNGTTTQFEFAERAPGVRILLHDGENLLLTQEWRHEQNGWDYRLPGGKVFDRLSDYVQALDQAAFDHPAAWKAAACKELREETGFACSPDQMHLITTAICGASVRWDLHFFEVGGMPLTEAAIVERIDNEEGEMIRPTVVDYEAALRLCVEGQVQEDRTAAVLMRFLLARGVNFPARLPDRRPVC